MKHLDLASLNALIADGEIAMVLCAAGQDPHSMVWAEAFAMLWRKFTTLGRGDVAFGHVDSVLQLACRLRLGARRDPMILFIRDGAIVRRYTDVDIASHIARKAA